MARFLRIPRPTRFLGFFDLQIGAELVFMSVVINKMSGMFGVLAIFTGAEISPVQLSMYFYSLVAFALLCILGPMLHRRSPLGAVSFAYFYLVDSIVNILYTVLFGVSWFLVLADKHGSTPLASSGKMIGSTSGFTNPALNVSHVDVVAAPANNIGDGQDAIALATPAETVAASGLGSGVLQPESATSIMIISILWAIRLYCILIVFSSARKVVRSSATPAEPPFEGRNGGDGWQGRLGRGMVNIGKGYWEGDGWAPFGAKFRRSTEPEDRRRFNRGHVRLTSLDV
ncbi:Inositolphosphorylceramide synthase subunit Kei1-domain-containing protein [Geopyxis carbonaria]|nr:Inositolphosphorylceramide synthase subunit Kei1-domain-containing protein [Geopyxis carbonaria]